MTTPRNRRARLSPAFLLLAGATLALSSWGLYGLMTMPRVGAPSWVGVLVVAGLDVAAVAFGKHALTVTEDGDSGLPWNLGLILLTALGATAQLGHAFLAGYPLIVGLVLMVFPIVTVALFEGQLRRRFRLQGRRTGRVAEPRATVDLMTWLFYRRLAMRATKLAVLDRGLDPDSALMIAEQQLAVEDAEADSAPRPRRMRRTYAVELAGGAVEDTLHVPAVRLSEGESVPLHGRPDVEEDEVQVRRTLSAVVADARTEVGDSLDAVFAVVQTVRPDAKRDTVRVTLNRLIEKEASA